MVWSLIPADPLSGEEKYYIFAKGTYKVGRKGCDVTIGNDKGVSRIHAEIIIDAMEPYNPMSSNKSSKVRLRDCSKYGTLIGRHSNVKEKVHESPGRELYLDDGDVISFGTGNVTYRFSYVPLVFYLCNFTNSQGTASTQDRVTSLGACVTHKWTAECTHVIVDPFMPVTEGIICAILSKKPLLLSTWLEFVAENRIRNDIPSYSSYIPTLTLEGASVIVADYRTRENCLAGYTFLLDSENKYRFQDKMQSLLEAAGATVLSLEDFDSNSQSVLEGEINRIVLVVPASLMDHFRNRSSLSKVKETDLISAVLSGSLDPSVIISPSILVSSSCSTGETVVADSDAETETATSDQPITSKAVVNSSDEVESKSLINYLDRTIEVGGGTDFGQQHNVKTTSDKKATKYEQIEDEYRKQHALSLGHVTDKQFVELNRAPIRLEENNLESVNLDVLYSQNLIVRDVKQHGVVNFKRFRKAKMQSGKSLSNLVPFSKLPYTFASEHAFMQHYARDSDYDKEISEYVKEEKKRKQMEAVADDLFNTEKGRRRGAAGTLRGLLGLS